MPKKRSLVYQREGSGNWYITGLRISTGTDNREEAEALAAKIRHETWLQDRMGVKPPRSWKEAVVKWLDEKSGKASIQDDIERLRWLNDHFGTVQDIGTINRDRVDAIMRLRKGVSVEVATPQNGTANKYVALVAGILNAAERQWSWGIRAPRLRYYKVRKDVGRALTVAEYLRLESQLPEHLSLVAAFALSTGLRAGKVFSLRWNQVNLESRSLTFTGTANKLGNTIPLNAYALQVIRKLRSQPVVHKDFVFTFRGKPVKGYGKEVWRAALGRAGIERIRMYDLRHTFNSWLAQNGVSREIRMRLVGHRMGDSHDRYTHLDVEHLRPYSQTIDTVLTQSGGQSGSSALAKMG